jgi:hypothetical protein
MVDVLILAGHRRDSLCAFTGYDERERERERGKTAEIVSVE